MTSIVRNAAHSSDVAATGAAPLVLSLDDEPKEKLATVFTGKDVVYFAAGASESDGPETIRKIDYDIPLKVFDAIELINGEKPRLIMISSLDVRDRSVRPAHYVSPDTVQNLRYNSLRVLDRRQRKP